MKLGAQMFTLKKQCATLEGLDESLKKVADIGYKYIHLSATCECEPEWLAERLKTYGLSCPVTHYSYDKIMDETDAVIAFHKGIGAKYIGIGSLPGFRTGYGNEKVEAFIERATPAIKKIAEAGLVFSYHNHDMEMGKTPEGKTFIEKIAGSFPENELSIILDAYWVQAGGGDPSAMIRKLEGKVHCIHFKDMVYDLGEEKIHIAPIGEGNMNYDAIIGACLDTGIEYGFVELDKCYDEDPFDCLKRSYQFLHDRYGLN